ncbi:pyridoxamine 5'-phosphate oxidase family protein [Paenibacillus alkalitolerans]|uniref:pyridoxamine 5'-phosphate oxidase family protein n=1 Tax=Paenibacillus alkalitolerans TaxID=2799335 RepID=UPI0018F512F7|nr:pyridoxamine 5'-phosphate oxidase family protein [Paenibacillus alkalitolerans]
MNSESAIEAGIRSAKQLLVDGITPIDREVCIQESLDLLERSEIAMVGSTDENGYPHIKAMFKIESDKLKSIWFSTITSSRRVSQFIRNPKASVYFYDAGCIAGLLLVGEMEVLQDAESKERLWKEGWEVYYPLGVTDPDYCILRFTAKYGDYYRGLQNITFDI